MADAIDGDVAFLHRFQHGALRAGAGAVDLVSEDDTGQNRAGAVFEIVDLTIVDADADDIGREQIGCELDALEADSQRGGQGLRQGRLADAGHIFEQHVAFAKEGRQQLIDNLLLAYDHLGDVFPQPPRQIPGQMRCLTYMLLNRPQTARSACRGAVDGKGGCVWQRSDVSASEGV